MVSGTTAFYTFLKLHPGIKSNRLSSVTYEEVQFFGSKLYENGLDWFVASSMRDSIRQLSYSSHLSLSINCRYMNFFSDKADVMFEKSATYFDSKAAPKQAYHLLPRAKIIIMLIDPVDRALSWYYVSMSCTTAATAASAGSCPTTLSFITPSLRVIV